MATSCHTDQRLPRRLYSNHKQCINSVVSTWSKMAEKGAVSWTVNLVEQLIDLYEGVPCLYNIKDSEYHDRNKKNRAFAEIATTLGLTGMYLLV